MMLILGGLAVLYGLIGFVFNIIWPGIASVFIGVLIIILAIKINQNSKGNTDVIFPRDEKIIPHGENKGKNDSGVKYCNNCGALYNDYNRICSLCGAVLMEEENNSQHNYAKNEYD